MSPLGNLEEDQKKKDYKMYYIIAPLIGILIGVATYYFSIAGMRSGAASNGQNSATPSLTAEATDQPQATTITISPKGPEVVTNEFYNWYISYAGDPFRSGAYKRSENLTDSFINLITNLEGDYKDNLKSDPIFCTKNREIAYIIGLANYNKDKTQANVMIKLKSKEKELYRVVLVKEADSWKIKDIMCRP